MDAIDDILEHYGRLGMRWGVRNPRRSDGRVGPTTVLAVRPAGGGPSKKIAVPSSKVKETRKSIKTNPTTNKLPTKLSKQSDVTPIVIKAAPGKPIQTSGGKNAPTSDDAKNAAVAKQKAKVNGPNSLSNQEMRLIVERINLEQQYAKLNPKQKTAGEKFLIGLMKSPLPAAGLAGAKSKFKDNKDPRVQTGLMVAEALVSAGATKSKKK